MPVRRISASLGRTMSRQLHAALSRSDQWGRLSVHVANIDRQEAGKYAIDDEIRRWVHPHLWHRAARALDGVPGRLRPALLREHGSRYAEGGESAALAHLSAVRDAWSMPGLSMSASDDDVRQYGEKMAEYAHAAIYRHAHGDLRGDGVYCLLPGARSVPIDRTVGSLRRWIEQLLGRFDISVPGAMLAGLIARVTSPRWWVRKLRAVVMRRLEGASIRAGMVHVRAGVYASDETVVRRGRAARRNAAALEAATAVNEIGQEYTLAELSALGVSNPEVRRTEMMVRIKGVEEVANDRGWCAYFATWTCPSRYHARLSPSGAANPAYDGSTPKDAQAHLTAHWARARAALHRAKIDFMGLRVAEPHHDGTPHWHLLIFCRRADSDVVRDVMRGYALAIDGQEPGAAQHRFDWEEIDYKKGSAVGYVAMYVSKAIDGFAVERDMDTRAGSKQETGLTAAQGAERVMAWARAWGIRQFQFFGVPGVGPWRELRRMREIGPDQLSFFDAWNAADLGDWAGYQHAMDKDPVGVVREARPSIYPGEQCEAVTGIRRGEAEWETRVHAWVIKWRGAANTAPRTCVNNCTEGVGDVDRTGGRADGEGSGCIEGGGVPAAIGNAGADQGHVWADREHGAQDRTGGGESWRKVRSERGDATGAQGKSCGRSRIPGP